MQSYTKHLFSKFKKSGYVFFKKAIPCQKLKKFDKKLFLIFY